MFKPVVRSLVAAILVAGVGTAGITASSVIGAGVATAASASTPCAPQVSGISAFVANQAGQDVTITGSCFGNTSAFSGTDVNFLAITDNNYPQGGAYAWWQACSSTASPLGPNAVSCSVSAWNDTAIHFSGFAGGYGSNGWVVNQGDPLVVSIWNANTLTGPTSCLVYVGSSASSCVSPLTVSLSTGSPTVAGVEQVPVANIPSHSVSSATGSGTGDPASAPLSSIPLSSIPLSSIPLSSIPLSSIPLSSIALPPAGSPSGILAAQQALQQTLLSDIVVDYPKGCGPSPATPCTGWQGLLAGTSLAGVPLQSVTLAQVVADPTADANLNSLTIGSIDLSSSPLSSIPLSSIPLSSIPLSSIDINGTTTASSALNAWCTELSSLGSSCSAFGIDPTSGSTNVTILTLALAGVPLSSIPLSSIPLSSIPLSSIPLSSIPLSSISLASSPLSSIPLSSIPLSSIPLSSIPLSSIPLSSIGSMIDCSLVNCSTDTLGTAYTAGAIYPSATLGQLPPSYYGTTLGQLLTGDSPFPNLTLGDLILAMIPPATFQWQSVNLASLPLAAKENPGGLGGTVTYTATLNVAISGTYEPISAALPANLVFVPGSVTLDGVAQPDPAVSSGQLTWPSTFGPLSIGTHILTFAANAGTGLGPVTASFSATADGLAIAASSVATVNVIDGEQPQINSASPGFAVAAGNLTTSPINLGSLNIGYLPSPGNLNDWTVSVPQNAELGIALTNLPATYDLELFGPGNDQLQGNPTQTLPGVTDNLPTISPGTTTEPTPGSQDLPVTPPPGDQLIALSNNPDGQSQYIQTTPLSAGTYVIQVSGYNGAYSAQPYLLQANILGGATVPSCTSGITYLSNLGAPYSGTVTIPNGVNTLFLVNTQRLTAAFGSSAEAAIMNNVQQVANDSAAGVVGAVIPVDAYDSVQTAYGTWNTNPCSTPAANSVVSAISAVVDQIRASNRSIQNVVVVGADDQIPFARVADGATQSNERDYGQTTFAGLNNPEADALSLGYYLSDDPYVASTPLGVGSATLYLPELGIGRLVENPAEIEGALTRFVNSVGNLDATTSLTTGYSFLTSGAQAVSANLATNGINPVGTLINESWTTSQLDSALNTSSPPGIDSINAHFDYSRALPAYDNTNGIQTNLFTTSDVSSLSGGRLLMSMGCHSGLDVTDAEVATSGVTTPVSDWAKSFADTGSLWVANTGYGYADTDTVAYSAKLMAGYATNLNGTMTLGAALSAAKQQYAAGNVILSPYDLKALMESTFYGLPMYHLNSPATPVAPPSGPATQTDQVTGLTEAPISLNLAGQLSLQTNSNGSYYQVNGNSASNPGTQTTEYRPIEPLATVPVTEPNLVAHGALLTGLQSTDTQGFRPAYSMPAVGSANAAPPLIGGAAFPGTLQRVATYGTFTANGTSQASELDLVAGQFIPDPTTPGSGTQRLFNSFSGDVFYLPANSPLANDFAPPTIDSSQANISGGGVTFSVQVTPSSSGDPAKEVVVLYTDASTPGTWTQLQLGSSDGVTWSGTESSDPTIQYIVEAVDAAGNVAVSNNEGASFSSVPPAQTSISLSGSPVVNGYYTGTVTVTITAPAGSTYVLDGGAPTAVPTTGFPVTGDGLHSITVTAPDGSTQTQSFSISSTQTTTLVTSSANPSQVGSPVTFTATVTAATAGAGPPTGNVEFLDGGAAITGCGGASGTPLDTTGAAQCLVTFSQPSTHQITAAYLGGSLAVSTSLPLTQVVNAPPATTTSLTSSADPSVVGASVTFTATVATSNSGTPTGKVEFLVGGTPIASCGGSVGVSLSSTGTATCPQTYKTTGLYNITAQYLGTTNFQPSASVVFSQIVTAKACSSFSSCNLSYLNLAGANLAGVNLSRSNLSHTNLTGANLSGAELSYVNLNYAILPGANLEGADLTKAKVSFANLSGDNLIVANLYEANLSDSDLEYANLTGANMTGTNFDGADLTGATF